MTKTIPTGPVILIPSLEPDARLPVYVQRLFTEGGFTQAVIVNDGSSEKYQPIFDELAAMPGVTVLKHEVNRGKGCALKTGYTHIRDNMPDVTGVITADADGQHTVEDCRKLADALSSLAAPTLLMGSRDFDLPDIPPKSRFGNKTTSAVFKLLYGIWLPDTQTGLRAFRREELQFMIDVPGERFEYEMQVLIACARARVAITPITITTVYENGENEGTHFHPIRDSYRIYKVILGNFIKFMGASIISFLIDNGIFTIFDQLVFPTSLVARPMISAIIARCISAPCNYLMNRKLVFESKDDVKKTGLRYAVLCVCILLMSSGSLAILSALGMPKWLDTIAKIIIDAVLYLVSYRVQNKWVFAPEGKQ